MPSGQAAGVDSDNPAGHRDLGNLQGSSSAWERLTWVPRGASG